MYVRVRARACVKVVWQFTDTGVAAFRCFSGERVCTRFGWERAASSNRLTGMAVLFPLWCCCCPGLSEPHARTHPPHTHTRTYHRALTQCLAWFGCDCGCGNQPVYFLLLSITTLTLLLAPMLWRAFRPPKRTRIDADTVVL